MDAHFHRVVSASLLCLAASGCATPSALRRQTIHQGDTVADIHQQQVLDNLAKFVVDPYSVPSFALAVSGAASVDDQCNGVLGLSWLNTGFDAANLGFGAERTQGTSWVTVPITDSRKLELMRCAYQRVLTRCGLLPVESTSCPDCTKRFNKFYTGREYGWAVTPDGTTCYQCENGQLSNLVPPTVDDPCVCNGCACPQQGGVTRLPDCKNCPSPGNGIVNSECLSCDGVRWFCWSRNWLDVPKGCNHVGKYCGMYVWVPCGPPRDELSKLTLAILDYAVHDDAELPVKEIEAYLDCNLQPTNQCNAHYTVRTVVSLDESTEAIHMGDNIVKQCGELPEPAAPADAQSRGLPMLPGRTLRIPSARPNQRRSQVPGAGIPLDQQLLNNL